jgi:hypothetical protein
MSPTVKRVTKRYKMIGRPLRVGPPQAEAYPDFSALCRRIFGAKKARKTGTHLVSEARNC